MGEGFAKYEEQVLHHRIRYIQDELDRAEVSSEALQEAYSDAVRQMFAMEDVGWVKFSGFGGDGPGDDIGIAKDLASKLGETVETNPLLSRGKEIRCSYQFADPYEIGTEGADSKISPQQWNIIKNPENWANVFSLEALTEHEGALYEGGNAFTEYSKTRKAFTQVPFKEIEDVIYDPMNKGVLRYVKRVVEYKSISSQTGGTIPRKVERWIPVSTYKPEGGYVNSIGGVRVDRDARMIVTRVNRKVGSVFGIPDAFAAAPWALAYSAYLRDGVKVLAALAEWVWKITPKKRPAAERAAAAVRNERGAGGTLFTDMDVQALPRADAVDLDTGRPLAAQVASALGISVVVLLADPSQSGSYGTAQTLSDPNRRTMQARRDVNTEYLRECLRVIGIKDPEITWAKMAPGTDKEEAELLSIAWGTGLFDPEEVRPRLAKLAQITLINETAPEGVLLPNNEKSLARSDVDADGTTSMTNGVGRDNVGVGAMSRTGKSKNEAGADSSSS